MQPGIGDTVTQTLVREMAKKTKKSDSSASAEEPEINELEAPIDSDGKLDHGLKVEKEFGVQLERIAKFLSKKYDRKISPGQIVKHRMGTWVRRVFPSVVREEFRQAELEMKRIEGTNPES
jgi:hypothetical protein